MKKRKIVALLPMKANSERIKRKNFRDFAGKPLFRWVLDTLLSVEEIDRVVINTDAREILAENGLLDSDRISIRDRKAAICGDLVSMNKIIADDIEHVDAEVYLMTHTTNPLLSVQTIRACIEQFNGYEAEGNKDSLFTVNKIQTRFYRENGAPINHDPNNLVRTQDLEPWYEENSNLYVFSKSSFSRTNARIGERPGLFVSPAHESLDIDEPDDWDKGLVAIKHLREKGVLH